MQKRKKSVSVVVIEKGFNMTKKEQKAPMYKRNEETKNIIQFDDNGYPSCEKHGAMICVAETRKLWRCIACGVGVSFGSVKSFDMWLDAHKSEKERKS